MEDKEAFIDLSLDPHSLVNDGRIDLPVQLSLPSPAREAWKALLIFMPLLNIVHMESNRFDKPDSPLCKVTFREWPNAMRWVAFFHPKSGNVAVSNQEAVLNTLRNFFSTTCEMYEGNRIMLETEGALSLLLDLWLDYFNYVPTATLRGNARQVLKDEYSLLLAIWRFFSEVPNPGRLTYPPAVRVVDGLLALTNGNARRLHKKALSQRVARILTLQSIPTHDLAETISTVEELMALVNRRHPGQWPRKVICTLVRAWKMTAHLSQGEEVALACAHIFITFHARGSSDYRYLTWAIRAGLIPLLFQLIRMHTSTGTQATPPALLHYIRVQMVYRNFVRVLRRYAGSAMVIREGDLPYVEQFIRHYENSVQLIEKTADFRWTPIYCANKGCSLAMSEHALKKCACRVTYYCSQECQSEDWKARHNRQCAPAVGQFVPGDLSIHSFRYAIISVRDHVNQQRETVSAVIAGWQSRNPLALASKEAIIVVDYTAINEPALNKGVDLYGKCAPTVTARPANEGERAWKIEALLPRGGCGSLAINCGDFTVEELQNRGIRWMLSPRGEHHGVSRTYCKVSRTSYVGQV
ncbi:hypothetical protein BD626DRAFT_397762 [Schizophyllum amplum]|uniref:MYND-type domain-containing protein n=1 Tax=Schizophyllum amplum TaxID=97359 RepID=A0A550CMH6_9AGAR|nr:hypothetical protein BD626DRAFT_397762 [Auriculariopsis ampla]